MLVVRTHASTLPNVVKHAKHALDALPRDLRRGDLILIAQTRDTLSPGQKAIRFVMEFKRAYPDRGGESKRIWGKQWRFIIEGTGCRCLRRPFDLRDICISGRDYGQGGPYMYVDPRDEAVLQAEGYLESDDERTS